MTISITLDEIFVENDCAPLVAIAKDGDGTVYLTILVDIGDVEDTHLCVQITPERLTDVKSDKIDLQDAFIQNEFNQAFEGRAINTHNAIILTPIEKIPVDWLPERGFPLSMFLPSTD